MVAIWHKTPLLVVRSLQGSPGRSSGRGCTPASPLLTVRAFRAPRACFLVGATCQPVRAFRAPRAGLPVEAARQPVSLPHSVHPRLPDAQRPVHRLLRGTAVPAEAWTDECSFCRCSTGGQPPTPGALLSRGIVPSSPAHRSEVAGMQAKLRGRRARWAPRRDDPLQIGKDRQFP